MPDVPFRIANDEAPLILLPVHVNGVGPLDFVLDTGNGAPVPVVVSPSLVQRLSLPPAPSKTRPQNPFPLVQLDSFELGDDRRERVHAGVLDAMDQIGARVGAPVAGNIGYSFLKDWSLGIDYQRSLVHLTQGARPTAEKGTPFETGPGGAFILLPALVNGQGPYRFLLDTGASASVVSPGLARDLGLSGEPVEALGVGGSTTAQLTTLESLEVAGHTVSNLSAGVVDIFAYTTQAAGVPVEGIIGYSFLKEFFVEINYPERRIYLRRSPE